MYIIQAPCYITRENISGWLCGIFRVPQPISDGHTHIDTHHFCNYFYNDAYNFLRVQKNQWSQISSTFSGSNVLMSLLFLISPLILK